MVRIFRTVRAARGRLIGLRGKRRAFGGGGRADWRRCDEVLPRSRGRHPRRNCLTTIAAWRRLDHLQLLLIGMLAALGLMTVQMQLGGLAGQLLWLPVGVCARV